MQLMPVKRCFSVNAFYSAFPFSWDESFEFHGESHRFWEIVYVSQGKVEVTEDEKVYILEKNDLILHAPMEFHRIRSAEGTRPEGLIMSFIATGTLPEELKKGIFTLSDEDRRSYEEIVGLVRGFLDGTAKSRFDGQEAADRLSALLIHLGSVTATRRIDRSPAATEYRRVVFAMAEHVGDNLTLSDFAAICNISVSYIKQLFKKYAGVSPKAYYTLLRAKHATDLLEQGLNAAQVADRMSFSSPNYFSVFYKKQTGVCPSAHKRK